jgi:hypothetical protein
VSPRISSGGPTVRSNDRPPRTTREDRALAAMRSAAAQLRVSPADLRATSYRSLRVRDRDRTMPSESAIREIFGGWERARERAGHMLDE